MTGNTITLPAPEQDTTLQKGTVGASDSNTIAIVAKDVVDSKTVTFKKDSKFSQDLKNYNVVVEKLIKSVKRRIDRTSINDYLMSSIETASQSNKELTQLLERLLEHTEDNKKPFHDAIHEWAKKKTWRDVWSRD
jgi:ribonuclease HII